MVGFNKLNLYVADLAIRSVRKNNARSLAAWPCYKFFVQISTFWRENFHVDLKTNQIQVRSTNALYLTTKKLVKSFQQF